MADVIVVGAGIQGLLASYELRQRGLSVVLLERDLPARQASWASAGILSQGISTRHDGPAGDLRTASVRLYPELVAALQEETNVDVELTANGIVLPARDEAEAEQLERDTAALRADGAQVALVSGQQLREEEPALSPTIPLARLEPGGQVDNRRLCQALELACRARGVDIVSGAMVTEIVSQDGRVQGVRTLEGEVPADRVVVAAGSWSGQLRGCDPTVPVVPQRGQILALGRANVPMRRVVVPYGDPYLVPRPDGRVIVGATRELAGYAATLTASGVAWLLTSAMDLVPELAGSPIVELWTGFRPLSPDGLPIIGPGFLDGLFFLTGHGPSGIAPAPASVQLLVALMLGEPPPVPAEPFDPRRFASAR
ncbi:MAG: glycine oxidase ThiO [Chloroflexi bacterium]|nr:glycine oxidase ThiO [Chloroflexota bacterium]